MGTRIPAHARYKWFLTVVHMFRVDEYVKHLKAQCAKARLEHRSGVTGLDECDRQLNIFMSEVVIPMCKKTDLGAAIRGRAKKNDDKLQIRNVNF